MAKKAAVVDRKARLEEMRRAQQASERRRTALVVAVAGVVVVGLVGAVGVVIFRQVEKTDITNVGVPLAQAACDPVTTDAATGVSEHIGPGTNFPNQTKAKYATVPPSSGQHFATPESPALPFYTAQDRPQLETLVHNLEHGYTIVWYDEKLPQAQKDQLRTLAPLARDGDNAGQKFIVSAWDSSRGAMPAGKPVAMSHWSKEAGHRQLCGAVSGEAVQDFVKKYPYTDSPEPNAA